MTRNIIARILHLFGVLRTCTNGNVMMLSAVAMPVLIGMAGLAIEGANWYQTKRLMQNAADSAAIAAATNNTARYDEEAKAVTGQYGFTNGTANTTVTASNTATCPSGTSTCYSVTITRKVSLVFSRLIGFSGSETINNSRVITLDSRAVAERASVVREYCILAMSDIGTALTSNGAPHADLNGCNVMSNSNATCNGHDLDALIGDAAGINNGCGDTANSNMPLVADPYLSRAANIPSNPCTSYPQATIHSNGKKVSSVGSANSISGDYSNTGNWTFCGDLVLTGNVELEGSSVVIVIYNGDLLTNEHTITTASGAAATIVFAGTSGSYGHIPNTTGVIDIKAPTSGVWSGIALYQDPTLTTGVDIDYRGSNPKTPVWNISGLVYMPKSNMQFSGVVNHASNGGACLGLVVYTLLVNGNGSIFEQGSCGPSGLTLPSSNIADRGKLVG